MSIFFDGFVCVHCRVWPLFANRNFDISRTPIQLGLQRTMPITNTANANNANANNANANGDIAATVNAITSQYMPCRPPSRPLFVHASRFLGRKTDF